ncbi:centrosomal protein 15-like [Montipora capricornis]|uniref:centrosomal protein 15-like n=1 Tax=Montipora foliosa TaxID=591990 RepID=UPI0035F120A2
MDDRIKYTKWLAREAQLSQKHEEILAKREMLLAANESLIGTPQKHFQDTLHGFQRTKTRNDQLIKELEALQSGLQNKVSLLACDAKFIGLQASYWKMVEEEFPRWNA